MKDAPFPTLGILGGGQLGRMTAQAAIRMGLAIKTLSPSHAGPVAPLGEAIVGDWTDPDVLQRFASGCSAITVESEWAPAEVIAPLLPSSTRLYPSPETLHSIRHKGRQKRILADAGLPVAPFRLCATLEEAARAAADFGFPVLLKKYQGSYDGYGNQTARSTEDVREAWGKLADEDGLLVEAFVAFRRELAVLVARRENGESAVYPVAHTIQRHHRCHAVSVPVDLGGEARASARRIAREAAEVVGMVGVLGVELFELESGEIYVNELAPRPHNSGHYTIEGSHTSQFENHVRAVMGWPLGNPDLRCPAVAMVNILGLRTGPVSSASLAAVLAVPGAALHLYGKGEVRNARKMGHITVTGDNVDEAMELAERAAGLVRL